MKSRLEFVLLMALLSASSALAIDMLLPGFEAMRETFGLPETSTRLALTLTLFFYGSAGGMLLWGPLADAIGRKPVLAISLGLYATAALAATLAPNLGVLLASRLVWGFASAGPRTLSQTIVRDRFEGDSLARINSLVMTAFFVGPVLAPVIGAGLLQVGSWRLIMAFGLVSAAIAMVWSIRLPETLDPQNRRPLNPRKTIAGFRSVFSNRQTLGYTLALTFDFGAFFSFLGSTELLFDAVFDRDHWFVPYFSIASVIMASSALTAARIMPRFGASTVAWRGGIGFMVAATFMVLIDSFSADVPNFWLWIVALTVANGFHTVLLPTFNALALNPMGDRAGTAASAVGVLSIAVGATLASLIDRSISDSVTPMAIGYLGFGGLSLLAQAWARRAGDDKRMIVEREPTQPVNG